MMPVGRKAISSDFGINSRPPPPSVVGFFDYQDGRTLSQGKAFTVKIKRAAAVFVH
jgi:hypothetical protein